MSGTALAAAPEIHSEADLQALLSRMTLEEKAGQLSLFAVAGGTADPNPDFNLQSRAQQAAEIRAGHVMGLFNGYGPVLREMQRIAVEESRLKIPLVFAADVIHGFRTVFPIPLAEAASFEPDLAERTARASAIEASAAGLRWNFAPMMDVSRDARWGRSLEGAGEDVLLNSRFAAARVRGYQTAQLGAADAMAATAKHFAGYGAVEGGLDYNSAELSEHGLRDVYLPPFRAALSAGAASVMTAFNDIAGVPANANPWLLRHILREEWGFDGITVSDYTADLELIQHGVAADERDAARLSLLAGVDVSMQSGLYLRELPELVRSGALPRARLDEAVLRVLRFKWRLGLFDDPYGALRNVKAEAEAPRHRALAREAARRSIVMLRNERGLLPLPRDDRHYALIGPFADAPADLHGPWTLFGDERQAISLQAGIREALGSTAKLTVVHGSDVTTPVAGGIEAAVAAAQAADVVLLAVGEETSMSGESRSRSRVTLPSAQQALAEAVAATGKPLVVLLRNGRPLALKASILKADALLVTWFLGTEAGHAIADVLFGVYSPSARLPMSFPQNEGQLPYYYAHRRSGRPTGSATAEYTTHYLNETRRAAFAFGAGQGYSRVEYRAQGISTDTLAWGGSLEVWADVHNAGTHTVEEVAQLYLRDRVAGVAQPERLLKDFQKLALAPGETRRVNFRLRLQDLAYLGVGGLPNTDPGQFDVWIAPSAEAGEPMRFTLLPP